MANLEEFYDKWSEILLTEGTVQPNGCIEVLQMGKNKQGYPRINVTVPGIGQRTFIAARLMYICHNRQLDFPNDVSHLCHNRLCINIQHLVHEPRLTNLSRKTCKNARACTNLHQPPCLFN